MFDVNNVKSFENLDTWRDEFLIQANPNDPDSFPFVVIGNKIDIEDSKRAVPAKKIQAYCAARGNLPYFETSAKEATGVEQAFEVIARNALQQDDAQDFSQEYSDAININLDTESSSCAC
jgi:Ras-related protein Rab-7A